MNPKSRGVSSAMRRAVYERDEFRCVACGTGSGLTVQHRQAVGMGGTRRPRMRGELLTACGLCNSGFESYLQRRALESGWKVRRALSPAVAVEVPWWDFAAGVWRVDSPVGGLFEVDARVACDRVWEANFGY